MSAALLAELAAARADLQRADNRLATIEAVALQGLDDAEPPETPQGIAGLQNPTAFYEHIRGEAGELFPTMNNQQVLGVEQCLHWGASRLPLSWMAYCLATAYHETRYTMAGVKEAYWLSEEWRRKNLRYYPWYGRGLVQLTHEANYRVATDELRKIGFEVDLLKEPDLAMRIDVAAAILVLGCLHGWFTGKKLRDYLQNPATQEQFANARRIVNGTDKREAIAGYAMVFQEALTKGDWK